jgi:hypothetical protein
MSLHPSSSLLQMSLAGSKVFCITLTLGTVPQCHPWAKTAKATFKLGHPGKSKKFLRAEKVIKITD